MKRSYSSGSQKRAKIAERERQISKLPKISEFCQIINKENNISNTAINLEQNQNQSQLVISNDFDNKNSSAGEVRGEVSGVVSTNSTDEGKTLCSHHDTSKIIMENLAEPALENTRPNEEIVDYSPDPALWIVNKKLIAYCVKKGPEFCQNKDDGFENSLRIYEDSEGKKLRRFLHKSLFKNKLKNGEEIDREWLLYSPSKGAVYCFVCRLFSTKNSQFSVHVFDDWKNGNNRVKEHEGGSEHLQCLINYNKRKNAICCIDEKIMQQWNQEHTYWKELLGRLITVIKFIATRGLAFRGANQELGSKKNGNYLGILELVGKYDPFLQNHFEKYGNKGHGHVSYLSANICEELIELMGKRVLKFIINELKKVKYYSICVDSTRDVSRIDELTFTVCYVTDQGPIERFLAFIPIEAHGTEYVANNIIKFLKDNEICLNDCRGQSYDNASNMSGQYSGLQARFKEINEFAEYIPCAGHSLNLVGESAAECDLYIAKFFSLVQKLYTFFLLQRIGGEYLYHI